MHFVRTTPKIFALADGRTERDFHNQNKFQNTLKENKICTMVDALKKKQTISLFPDLSLQVVGMDNGIIDLWDPST